MSNSKKFGEIRKAALDIWQKETKRNCELLGANLEGFELSWQNQARELNYRHVSFFCSLNSWAKNIDDIFTDSRYDDFLLEESTLLPSAQTEALFRYYTRMLLVISEVIEDFVILYQDIICDGSIQKYQARAYYSTDVDKKEVKDLSTYINTVCKHKINKLHNYNHHIYSFEGAYSDVLHKRITTELGTGTSVDSLMIGQSNTTANASCAYIIVPELSYCLSIVVNCYKKLDDVFFSSPDAFTKVCDKYDQKLHVTR